MADKVVQIAVDPVKARLKEILTMIGERMGNKPALTPLETEEAMGLIVKKLGIE